MTTTLPLDPELASIARLVNAKLPEGVRVDFYRVQHPDKRIETRCILQCGSRRHIRLDCGVPTEDDVDRVADDVRSWAAKYEADTQYQRMWTKEAPLNG